MPLKGGYSKSTILANAKELMETGRDRKQAWAIALANARAHFKKKHPQKPLPEHLKEGQDG